MLTTWGILHLAGTIPRKVNIYTLASFIEFHGWYDN